jgi:hypothetical protein
MFKRRHSDDDARPLALSPGTDAVRFARLFRFVLAEGIRDYLGVQR